MATDRVRTLDGKPVKALGPLGYVPAQVVDGLNVEIGDHFGWAAVNVYEDDGDTRADLLGLFYSYEGAFRAVDAPSPYGKGILFCIRVDGKGAGGWVRRNEHPLQAFAD